LLHTEEVVRRFSRYHKYTVGTDLRQQAMALMRGVHVAVYDRPNQSRHVHALVWQVDNYKLTLQLAIDIDAFVVSAGAHTKKTSPGFAAFEIAAQLAGQKPVAEPLVRPASLSEHTTHQGAAPAGVTP